MCQVNEHAQNHFHVFSFQFVFVQWARTWKLTKDIIQTQTIGADTDTDIIQTKVLYRQRCINLAHPNNQTNKK